MFSTQLPITTIILLCRALRHGLSAGLSPVKVLRTQARQGPPELRRLADRLADALEQGTAFEDALKDEKIHFPPLFVSLAGVGEQTGNLPEVVGELERYYEMQLSLRRQFISQITWPVFQFFAAVIIIALLILILGVIAESKPGQPPIDALGLGLVGARGAVIFLAGVATFLASLFGGYLLVTRVLGQAVAVHRLLLAIPVLGPALHALALTRFSMALSLTMEAGLSITKALRRSFRATDNPAYESRADAAVAEVKQGRDLTGALRATNLFPDTYLQIMEVAEESGQVPESMRKQTEICQEEASRKLKLLTQAASGMVWLFVAIMIITAIFRIARIYLNAIEAAGI
jgi:type IV pilus assembly protein PilC